MCMKQQGTTPHQSGRSNSRLPCNRLPCWRDFGTEVEDWEYKHMQTYTFTNKCPLTMPWVIFQGILITCVWLYLGQGSKCTGIRNGKPTVLFLPPTLHPSFFPSLPFSFPALLPSFLPFYLLLGYCSIGPWFSWEIAVNFWFAFTWPIMDSR
jgi:hypothetical protein